MKISFVTVALYAKNLRRQLVSFLYSKCCKWGIHTSSNPKWEIFGYNGAAFASYRGKCRICNEWITEAYKFYNMQSPLYIGVKVDSKGNRDIEAIIKNCITFFIEPKLYE